MNLFHDFRGQISWGRVCALVALIVAVIGQFSGVNIESVKVWLSVAVGNYGASKLTEIVAGFSKVGVEAPAAPEGPGPGRGQSC